MRIIFVRHGEPDYARDCLTETGRKQAAAAAERLAGEGISEIYASTMGRAMETASFTARKLNLTIVPLAYMREISWGGEGIPADGHPWTLGDWMIAREDFDFYRQNWREHPYFKKNDATEYYRRITAEFDGFLENQGYRHEGGRFLCTRPNGKTIALFSHGGSGACVLSHLLGLPFPYVCTVMPYYFTSLIVLEFADAEGSYVYPRLEAFNDVSHLNNLPVQLVIQQETD